MFKKAFIDELPKTVEPYVLRVPLLLRENYDIAGILYNPFPMQIRLTDVYLNSAPFYQLLEERYSMEIESIFTSDMMLTGDAVVYVNSNKELYRAMTTVVLDEEYPSTVPRSFKRGEMFL